MSDANTTRLEDPAFRGLRLADWLFRPWYAKLWWVAIPVWWLGMAASTKVAPLAEFYSSALAGFLNILFFPMTALMVLGVGYARVWLDRLSLSASVGGDLNPDSVEQMQKVQQRHAETFGDLNAATDIYDPRSGALSVTRSAFSTLIGGTSVS